MKLDPRRTLFVDIDTQRDFMEPEGALYVPGAETLKGNLSLLVGAAKESEIPVLASADAHPEGDPEFELFPPHCLAGSEGARRVEETEPREAAIVPAEGTLPETLRHGEGLAGTVIVEKVAFDMFTNPAAELLLERSSADCAVVFGVALDYCVRAAALGLCARGYRTWVVEDATKPVRAESGAEAERELREAGVLFVRTAEVLEALTE